MNKYDRQLRLWSESGQKSLQTARVLILGLSATTSEVCKNLVLAGVGSVTIVDDAVVDQADCAANFCVTVDDLGLKRAVAAANYVSKLNADASVQGIDSNVNSYIDNAQWSHYSVIITSRLPSRQLNDLRLISNLPIVQADSFGFYGRVRSFFCQLEVVETHPESAADFRFTKLWPELRSYIDSIDLEVLPEPEHEQIPFFVFLIKALDAWLAKYGKIPGTSLEKKQFRNTVSHYGRVPLQENIEEARTSTWRVFAPPIPQGIWDIFHLEDAQVPKTPFYLLVAALKVFVDTHDALPLSGVLPDMKTDTTGYNTVKELFTVKAKADAAEMDAIQKALAKQYCIEPAAANQVGLFAKNCRYIQVLKGTTVVNDNNKIASESSFSAVFTAMENACAYLFAENEQDWDENAREFILRSEPPIGPLLHIFKSRGGELHSVAAVVGGIAAQEASKVIMKQYTPFMHTLLYNAELGETYVSNSGEIYN